MIVSCLIEQLFVFLYQTIQAQGNIRNFNIFRSIVNILPLPVAIFQYVCGWQPYWIIIDWILFKVICGGVLNLYFAHKNVKLSITQWLMSVLLPCSVITAVSCAFGFVLTQYGHYSLKGQLFDFLILFVFSLPSYWFFGIGKMDRQKILGTMRRQR